MEDKELSPSDSLALITSVIQDAKTRFRDNGFAYIFIGSCIFIASLGQFILLQLKLYEINYYPYFIMPVAGVITYIYYSKKRSAKQSKNVIGETLSAFGILLGVNTTILSFIFWKQLGIALFPVMFVLCSIWSVLTGFLIRYRIFIYCGILVNIIAFIAFFVSFHYHPLLMSITALVVIVVPGIFLNQSKKKSNV